MSDFCVSRNVFVLYVLAGLGVFPRATFATLFPHSTGAAGSDFHVMFRNQLKLFKQ